MITAHIPQSYRVTFMALDSDTAYNVRSTKWYHSIEEIPAKYRAIIGVKYEKENPCRCFAQTSTRVEVFHHKFNF